MIAINLPLSEEGQDGLRTFVQHVRLDPLRYGQYRLYALRAQPHGTGVVVLQQTGHRSDNERHEDIREIQPEERR